ncbi:hypothetical protein [Chryseobacterium arthrosphaerae]|uniref:hypothetical protein n=1 Tax=Chryseobacterium arthrosphaerae TaxID=651561 RepID=UPI001E3E99CD|nr:hypothetical protein [Chryseobacterium arthrosphaerae]UEQ77237.1 hypothetical protein J8N07_02720 [Chryseobacterium arthrosphaerae]
MKHLETIEEIKKGKNLTLENIVTIFNKKRIPKNASFHLIKINFNYEDGDIIKYLDLIYGDELTNPFNKDFIDKLNFPGP